MGKRYVLAGVFVAFSGLLTGATLAAAPEDLQRSIEDKGKELQEINSRIRATQSQIIELQGQGKTLKQALATLGYQVDQVNLGIKSSEINIDKLRLELKSLGYELNDVSVEIDGEEEAIAKILRQLQQKDRDGLLVVLLKNETLADGLFEIQSLRDVQNNLSLNVSELTTFQEQLESNLVLTTDKKSELEVENVNLKSRKSILADQQAEKDRLLKETKNQEGLYQKKLTELESQQRGILDEITRIEAELRTRFKPADLPSKKTASFVWPITLDGGKIRITQNWGETALAGRFYKGQAHNGMDIGAPIGTPVYAADGGKIVRVDYNGRSYQYGRYILIDHGNGLSTLYAHLSETATSGGQSVTKGQLIGYVGATGFVTGPHLHFGVYATPSGGWQIVNSKSQPGFVSVPPASGLVPIGITLNPQNYL
ncbi:MAG: Peptidase M23 [Candidatus Azambacteria bacterium GW2011_GWA1_44_9]|uniref:Peptidase M23 n=1 Tax=Candidatus Azambacteria bacterium GW2011_GWA1_44_9 TaxID=1618610 RepID=A0A0G1KAX0_9BACT|nr:MAG: Peptidase M23 [Candidatus Azambacteria bacterium GW2011_GWA1_44_9]